MPDFTSPQWGRSALIVIDVQRDFIDGVLPVPGTGDLVPVIAEVVDAFRRAGRPIVHVVRLYVPGSRDVDLPRRAAVLSGQRIVAPHTPGAAIPARLLPHPVDLDAALLLGGEPQPLTADEIVLYKPRWSAFHRTVLEQWLRERDVSTVVVLGCNLPNCPRATLFDAGNRDFRTVLVTDATSGATPDRLHDLGLIGTRLLTAHDVQAALPPS